jgi:hypothetical protein
MVFSTWTVCLSRPAPRVSILMLRLNANKLEETSLSYSAILGIQEDLVR